MDAEDYRRKIGVDADSVESMLMYCAFLRNVYCVPHRTLREFSWFVDARVFGPDGGAESEEKASISKRWPRVRGDRPLLDHARAFVEYCEEKYRDDPKG